MFLASKFVRLGPVDTYDFTISVKAKFQKHQVKWVESDALLISFADLIRSIGSFLLRQ